MQHIKNVNLVGPNGFKLTWYIPGIYLYSTTLYSSEAVTHKQILLYHIIAKELIHTDYTIRSEY